MTSKTTYSCNLCNKSIEPDGSNGKGVRFETNGKYLVFKHVTEVHHHICDQCIVNILREAQEEEART